MKKYYVHYKSTTAYKACDGSCGKVDGKTSKVIAAEDEQSAVEQMLQDLLHEMNNGYNICQVFGNTVFSTDMNGNSKTVSVIKAEEVW